MSDDKYVNFSLKIMVNKNKTKVLFAQADSDFTDVLLSFLTLPFGKIVKVLKNHYGNKAPVVGSITTLYNSIANMDSGLFWTSFCKSLLLSPTTSVEGESCIDGNCSDVVVFLRNYFGFGDRRYGKRKISQIENECKPQVSSDGDGVFTLHTTSFVISDDLHIIPVVPGMIVQTLVNLGITDLDGTEIRTLILGFNEIMDLLMGSLLSETPLTYVFLRKRSRNYLVTQNLLPQIKKESSSSSNKKMSVKAMVQKSTNKILFAEAEENFVDFLCSFLTIPLAGVECLLGGNTSLKNIENIYRSIQNIDTDKYFKTKDTKALLLESKVYHGYISKNQILPLIRKDWPPTNHCNSSSFRAYLIAHCSSVYFPKGEGKYVKGPRTYKVTDDLIVTPFCMISSLSILNELKIPLTDVKEVELEIGLEEALNILKASLTSTSALTNGLIKSSTR